MKMKLSDLPIRRKLTLIVVITCAIVLTLSGLVTAWLDIRDTRRAMLRDTIVLADVVAQNTRASLAFHDPDSANTTLRALESEPNIRRAVISDAAGRRFAEYTRVNDEARGGGTFTVSRPITVGGKRIGTITIDSSTQRVMDRLKRLEIFGAFVLAGAMIVAVAASWMMQRIITEPLRDLISASRVIAEKTDFTVRAHKRGNDEIGELTDTFNGMLDVLEQRGRSLEQLNEDLESRVKDRTAQLERANRELESFSYSVSHDLRAPLRAVDGFSRLLQEDHGSVLDKDGQRLLTIIRDEARRMGVLIDDLLNFSRLSRQPLRPAAMDLAATAEAILNDLRRTRPDRDIEFIVDPALPRAMADIPTMRQALVNLLSNAVKYAKKEGPIRIELGARRDGEMNEYWLKDQGVGFDMRYVSKIFGVFQRLHGDEFEGTGVGLAIVERVVARHGGTVRAEGVVGEGACFHFTLPATQMDAGRGNE
jgi:signal transduction histidine kinase